MEHSVKTEEPITFTDRLRAIFGGLLHAVGSAIASTGLHPNVLTASGVVGTLLGAYFVALGQFTLGGFIIMLMGPIDALDGAVARARGEPEDFGAFVDSVSDRYIELFIYGGLLYYYVGHANWGACMAIFAAAAGSVLVSYVRARAQSLGFETKVGLLTRVERYFVTGPSILFGAPLVGVIIVAVGANITALQRIAHVRSQAHSRKNQSGGVK